MGTDFIREPLLLSDGQICDAFKINYNEYK
jgi:hypothetical protein